MKTVMSISIDEDDAEELKKLCAHLGIPVSRLLQEAVKGYVRTAKLSRIMDKRVSKLALLRFFAKGMSLEAHE